MWVRHDTCRSWLASEQAISTTEDLTPQKQQSPHMAGFALDHSNPRT
jgi:hypothetical protein